MKSTPIRGLSQLQRRILMLALRNKEAGATVHFISADAFIEIYGFAPADPRYKRHPSTPGTQNFRVEDIGRRRYASAKVAVWKAIQRLMDRELVHGMVNIVKHFVGVRLTEEGVEAAATLTANLRGTSPQVSHYKDERQTANLVEDLPPSKPLRDERAAP